MLATRPLSVLVAVATGALFVANGTASPQTTPPRQQQQQRDRLRQHDPYSTEVDAAVSAEQEKYLKATTLENLQTAYNGESNAANRYLAFAKKADQEGYGKVGSLFRAAARAEQIHAANHAEVIKTLGAVPKAEIVQPEVKTTKENLEVAISGELAERQTMYPAMMVRARQDGQRQAIRSFNFAMTAEQGHADLYRKALTNLESWRGGPVDFFVCTVCGYTVEKIDFRKCPSCFIPAEEYVKVS